MVRQKAVAARSKAERFAASVTLRQIRYFIAVAETGKVSAAGSMLSISPSVVTEAIAELEALSGVSLFKRHPRGLELTNEGHNFLSHARNVLSAVDGAGSAVIQSYSETHGNLTLAVTITVMGYFIAPLLTRFRLSFPNIEIRVAEMQRTSIERGLLSGEFDMALMLSSNLSDKKKFSGRTLVSSMRRLWLPPGHPLLLKDLVTLKDVSLLPYIQLMIDDAETSTASYWRKHKLTPKILVRTESVEAVRSFIAHHQGVSILSDMMYRPWSLEGDRIEVRELAESIPMLTTGLVWARGKTLGPAAQAFLNFCQMEAEILRYQSHRSMPPPTA